jgi:hypothetical protein
MSKLMFNENILQSALNTSNPQYFILKLYCELNYCNYTPQFARLQNYTCKKNINSIFKFGILLFLNQLKFAMFYHKIFLVNL